MRFVLLLAAAGILVRDPTSRWTNDPLQGWFDQLRNKAGLYCCSKADGHPIEDGDWDVKDNAYRVFVEGKWIAVPDNAVILGPNKFGEAIVWLWNEDDLLNQWGATVSLALTQAKAAEAARHAPQPAKQSFAIGSLAGQEADWLPHAQDAIALY
jgi:hypothetical protein